MQSLIEISAELHAYRTFIHSSINLTKSVFVDIGSGVDKGGCLSTGVRMRSMSSAQAAGVWAVSACAVIAILTRPRRIPEWIWAVAGAVAVAAIAAMSLGTIAAAVLRGGDVYAFLIGILTLAELGRAAHVFDWIALRLLRAAGGSQPRLLGLVYLAGTLVTALLSNDTTVVVLTPAVLAALARSKAQPLPYLYACAFVANAASFVLPVSNPANLVLFGHRLPSLVPWLAAFGAAALAAVVLTYLALRLLCAADLRGAFTYEDHEPPADGATAWAAALLGLAATALVVAAFLGVNVGYTALGAAAVALGAMRLRAPAAALESVRRTQWSIVPLVAGLFVIVAALDRSGAIGIVRDLLHRCEALGTLGLLYGGVAVTIACNLFNNLPVALASGVALQSMHVAPRLYDGTLVAIDLGPNLSVSGSLATLLWLTVLRREGIEVTPLQFLRAGAIVLIPALIAGLMLVR